MCLYRFVYLFISHFHDFFCMKPDNSTKHYCRKYKNCAVKAIANASKVRMFFLQRRFYFLTICIVNVM
jgi:hypothetical protein